MYIYSRILSMTANAERRLNGLNKQEEIPAENIEFSSKCIFLVYQRSRISASVRFLNLI